MTKDLDVKKDNWKGEVFGPTAYTEEFEDFKKRLKRWIKDGESKEMD